MTETLPAILVVDDVEANLVALDAELCDLSCEIVRASSGQEALRQLLKREFALILLDVQMPGMDGFEVARLARDNPSTSTVPIVFVTAMMETEENLLRGYGTGAVDVLFKPINASILRSKVEVFLDLYRSRRRLAEAIEARDAMLIDLEAFNYSVSHDLRARNAWKFTRHKERARIEVGTAPARGERAYFIRDDGAGFDPKYASKLFHPFQRLHTTSEFEGTGIGLAIVHRIIRHHGGRIWAESAVGRGATFSFTLGERGR